ncbi:MAG: FAD-dependent oxidoreductase, partial [Opitutaceae bacterium]
MNLKTYDFISIGGGSAGFNAARVAAGLGLKTAVVDGAKELGGLCILRGCMPSKTLLYMAEVLHLARQGAKFGLKIPFARADLAAMQARKRRIIRDFADYREKALHSGRFDLIRAGTVAGRIDVRLAGLLPAVRRDASGWIGPDSRRLKSQARGVGYSA